MAAAYLPLSILLSFLTYIYFYFLESVFSLYIYIWFFLTWTYLQT